MGKPGNENHENGSWIDENGFKRKAGSGAFAKGNRAGPGRPKLMRSLETEIRALGRQEDLRKILHGRIDAALNGDVHAADQLLGAAYREIRSAPPQGPEDFKLPEFADVGGALDAIRALAIAASQEQCDPEWLDASLRTVRGWVDVHLQHVEFREQIEELTATIAKLADEGA